MVDPRLKILFGTILILLTATISEVQQGLILLGIAFIFALVNRIAWPKYLKRLLLINSFILFLIPFVLFTKSGIALFQLGPLTATNEGAYQAALIFTKLNTIILLLFSTFLTVSLVDIGKALQRLHLNRKLIFIFFFCCRYLTLLKRELQRTHSAIKVRGFRPATNLHTYKTIAYLFGSLLINSLDRAERVNQAMICRGFDGTFHSIVEQSFTNKDYLYAFFMTLLTLFTLWIDYGYQY